MRQRPIDRAWPALPLIALALAAVVAVVGVLAAPRETEVQRIDDTVSAFARAAQEKRGEDACALLTPDAQRTVAARLGTLTCAETVRSFGVGFDTARLRVAKVVAATVTGQGAIVARDQLVLADGAPFGGGVVLVRTGERWRINAFPRA